MKKLLIIFCVLALAGSTGAVTIFETFDNDPLSGSWTKSETDSSFTYLSDTDPGYVGGGHMEARMVPGPSTDRYTTSLGQTFDQTQEFWMEFDMQTVYHYRYQRGLFGVFNNTSNNETNVLADFFWRANNDSYSQAEMTHRIDSWDSTGAHTYYIPDYVFLAQEPVRAKYHYYRDGSDNGVVELELWRLNAAGSADDVQLLSDSTITLTPSQTLTYDLFGFGNDYADSPSSYSQTSWIDNVYFSTDGANTTYVDPAFAVPEPGTMGLFVLGGLLAMRRKK